MPSIETNRTHRPDLLAYLRTGHHPDAAYFARKYNHNHDPANGQFTFGSGGGEGSSTARPTSPSLRDLVATPAPDPPRVQLAAGGSGGRSAENRLVSNMRAETNTMLMEAANARIRTIAPHSPALQQLRAADVEPASSVVRQQIETANYLENVYGILRPNGTSWLGREFNSRQNRNIYGGAAEFNRLADSLTSGATLRPSSNGYLRRYSTPSGGNITLRTGEAVSPNTPDVYGVIDINITGLTPRHFAIKVHK
jgi:hypothetical protein